ncbi:MAG TPA: hypothetical protein VGM69_05650 [Chloroflexota bacterium]
MGTSQRGRALARFASPTPREAPSGFVGAHGSPTATQPLASEEAPGAGDEPSRTRCCFAAGLLATGPIAPVAAAVLAAVVPAPGVPPLVVAAGYFVACWLTLALICHLFGFTAADRANRESYDELRMRRDELGDRLEAACRTRHTPCRSSGASGGCPSCREMRTHLQAIDRALGRRGLQWFLGWGYIDLWHRVHRVEEALIDVESPEAVLADARFDELRLAGADGLNTSALAGRLKAAITRLRALAASAGAESGREAEPRTPASHASARSTSETELRACVRHVRRAVNEYRDQRRAGLVRARNYLGAAVAATGIALYALLWVGIGARLPEQLIQTIAALYLVGALVGLFNRLNVDSGKHAVGNDYGLSFARLVATPLLSGVGAILGVAVVALLAATQADHGAVPTAEILPTAFDLAQRPLNLLTAAVFGLTPGLIVSRLSQQAEQYRTDLNRSKATESAPPSA